MAIDLFCYSSQSLQETQEVIDLLVQKHQGLFVERFLISPIREAGSFNKETALEYGLHAHCMFLVRVNDKSATDLLPTVELLIKSALGAGNVIILFENETLR